VNRERVTDFTAFDVKRPRLRIEERDFQRAARKIARRANFAGERVLRPELQNLTGLDGRERTIAPESPGVLIGGRLEGERAHSIAPLVGEAAALGIAVDGCDVRGERLARIAFVEPRIRAGPGAQALGAFEECFARDSRVEQCGLEFFELDRTLAVHASRPFVPRSDRTVMPLLRREAPRLCLERKSPAVAPRVRRSPHGSF